MVLDWVRVAYHARFESTEVFCGPHKSGKILKRAAVSEIAVTF
jgi:hypothetical protein